MRFAGPTTFKATITLTIISQAAVCPVPVRCQSGGFKELIVSPSAWSLLQDILEELLQREIVDEVSLDYALLLSRTRLKGHLDSRATLSRLSIRSEPA